MSRNLPTMNKLAYILRIAIHHMYFGWRLSKVELHKFIILFRLHNRLHLKVCVFCILRLRRLTAPSIHMMNGEVLICLFARCTQPVHAIYNPDTNWYNPPVMKKKLHPQFHTNVQVTCACGNTFQTGSTSKTIDIEICSACHPFYTGTQRIVDTESMVKKFEEKRTKAAQTKPVSKRSKRAKRRSKVSSIKGQKKLTLKDMLKDLSS